MSKQVTPEGQEIAFEQALERLAGIVASLEDGKTPLADSLQCFEEGVRLLNLCQSQLDSAQRKIELLTGIDAEGRPLTVPFDDSATFDAAGGQTAGRDGLKTGIKPEMRESQLGRVGTQQEPDVTEDGERGVRSVNAQDNSAVARRRTQARGGRENSEKAKPKKSLAADGEEGETKAARDSSSSSDSRASESQGIPKREEYGMDAGGLLF